MAMLPEHGGVVTMTDIPLSNTLFLVRLPSGNNAVYSVQPQHIAGPENDLNNRAMMYGVQFAVCLNGVWHHQGKTIDDKRTIQLLESSPKTW